MWKIVINVLINKVIVRQVGHLQEFYNTVLNTLSNGIWTVCITGWRGVEGALECMQLT